MEACEGELHLGLDTDRADNLRVRRSRDQVVEQRGLAYARLAGQNQRAALPASDSHQNAVEQGALLFTAPQTRRSSSDRRTNDHKQETSYILSRSGATRWLICSELTSVSLPGHSFPRVSSGPGKRFEHAPTEGPLELAVGVEPKLPQPGPLRLLRRTRDQVAEIGQRRHELAVGGQRHLVDV